ncbi:substrate-binding domain-containing protein [Streptomyces cahuitamycinicus]|uniref:DNA-binding transcriptional regulator n=1 Tax=Streptomyces cahuitamycinicus TaxID=2070367 RepID=A0A2N8TYA1_9ACTN|nr:substrate-binding domain-containing protein [Streptomyces cahuitamycinicus]PNG23986.1 DNA-binding transcriptional regulator [Streptomyces cahuitamycinicus]
MRSIGTQQMFALQRRERLMDQLRLHGAVRVRDLARELSVSELTIRRDIAALADRGLLTRVHGGATLPSALEQEPVRRRRLKTPAFTLGMVVPSLDFYWPQIVSGARNAAAAHGVNMQLRGSSYDRAEDCRQIVRLTESGQVQGLLLAPNLDGPDPRETNEMIDWISKLPIPVVFVERKTPEWTPTPHQLEWVRSDHALGLEMAVRHLHALGHRNLGLVLSKGSPTSAHLAVGWHRVCGELGLPDDFLIRESIALSMPGHRGIISDILDGCRRSRTTALIVHSDPDAISLLQYLTERGIRVPDDMALVSYDDEVAHLADPAITAVRPPKALVGRMAVEMLVARLLEGSRRPVERALILPELMIRASSLPGSPNPLPGNAKRSAPRRSLPGQR